MEKRHEDGPLLAGMQNILLHWQDACPPTHHLLLTSCFAVAPLPMATCPLTGVHTGTSSEKCDAVDKSCLHGLSAGLEGVNGISAPVAQALNTHHWE